MNATVETPRGINFSLLPLERKLEIKILGRAIPEINKQKPLKIRKMKLKEHLIWGFITKMNEYVLKERRMNFSYKHSA